MRRRPAHFNGTSGGGGGRDDGGPRSVGGRRGRANGRPRGLRRRDVRRLPETPGPRDRHPLVAGAARGAQECRAGALESSAAPRRAAGGGRHEEGARGAQGARDPAGEPAGEERRARRGRTLGLRPKGPDPLTLAWLPKSPLLPLGRVRPQGLLPGGQTSWGWAHPYVAGE